MLQYILILIIANSPAETKDQTTFLTFEELQQGRQAKSIQSVKLSNYESFSFHLEQQTIFVYQANLEQPLQLLLNAYWLQQGYYNVAQIKRSEVISLVVINQKQKEVLREEFYVQFGLNMKVEQGGKYVIKLSTKSSPKIIMAKIEKQFIISSKKPQMKLQSAVSNVKNAFQANNKNHIILLSERKRILYQLQKYFWISMLQTTIIVVTTALQLFSLRNLMKPTNII